MAAKKKQSTVKRIKDLKVSKKKGTRIEVKGGTKYSNITLKRGYD